MSKRYEEATAAILTAIDVVAVYRSLGLDVTKVEPNGKGFLSCRAIGREDKNPSAAINVSTGYYIDKGGQGASMSLWDFAAEHGPHDDWKAARKHYANEAGVSLETRGRPKRNPSNEIVIEPWLDIHVKLWCRLKPPITPEAVRAAGCKLARHPAKSKAHLVLAMPIYGPMLTAADPIGYVIWQTGGRPLPIWNKQGKVQSTVKIKTVAGSRSGLMGQTALSALATSSESYVIWKVEGPSDMLALWSVMSPEERETDLVICNSGGATENISSETALLFGGHDVRILHDADQAGEVGAAKWIQAITPFATKCCQIRLPYPVLPAKGQDLRDWLAEGHSYNDLKELAKTVSVAPVTDTEQPVEKIDPNERIVAALQLQVLGERENGNVVLFAGHPERQKTVEVRDFDRVTYPKLLQIAGPIVLDSVNDANEDVQGKFPLSLVRNAICSLAGKCRLDDQLIGHGCWQPYNDDGSDLSGVLIVGAGEAAYWDPVAKMLTKILTPCAYGRLLNFHSTTESWYSFDDLERELANWTPAKSRDAIQRAIALFARWRWANNESCPILLVGLIMASFVQTMWPWRPHVALVGASKSGKSTLFEAVDGIVGSLAVRSSKSSAAGIRQKVKDSASIILADEFEQSKYREEILELARASSRGDNVLRGTPGQKGFECALKHIFWLAAIEVGLKKAPDRNRYITLETLVPEKKNEGQLQLPPLTELRSIGRDLFVATVQAITNAIPVAVEMKTYAIEGVDSRVIESYAVPTAIFTTACGYTDVESRGVLKKFIVDVHIAADRNASVETASDEVDLIQEIMMAEVRGDRGYATTVAQALILYSDETREMLGRYGITFTRGRSGPLDSGHQDFVFFDTRAVGSKLLEEQWKKQNVDTILARLEGASKFRCTVGGRRSYGVIVPWKWMIENIIDEEGEVLL